MPPTLRRALAALLLLASVALGATAAPAESARATPAGSVDDFVFDSVDVEYRLDRDAQGRATLDVASDSWRDIEFRTVVDRAHDEIHCDAPLNDLAIDLESLGRLQSAGQDVRGAFRLGAHPRGGCTLSPTALATWRTWRAPALLARGSPTAVLQRGGDAGR